MADISEECQKYLREIDRRLQMISSAAAHETPVDIAVQSATIAVKRMADATADLDDDCREILRRLDEKLDAMNEAVASFQGYAEIYRLVEEARASIRPGGGASVLSHG